jgi:MFS transporter, FSR family, fosmidomycin resistance protein
LLRFPSKFFQVVKSPIDTGWYPILKGNLYSAPPGQSASIMAIESVTTPAAKLLPLLVDLLADKFGLGIAI